MIGVIDYGMGNTGSIVNMLKRIGSDAFVVSDPRELVRAKKIILPGVGSFDNAVIRLKNDGFWDALNENVKERGKPLLGICLGMQLLSRGSEEGLLPGFGWIPSTTVRFKIDQNDNNRLKIPHMGWNDVKIRCRDGIFNGFDADVDARFYFVHSFHVVCDEDACVLATTDYGYPFHSAIGVPGITGVQFHPEKSHSFGMKLMKNFAGIKE